MGGLSDTLNMALSETIQPRPNLVRAWFDTVLNPLVGGLRTEAHQLESGELSWRFEWQKLVSLVPVKEHIAAAAWDNWEQFVSLYPQCQPPTEKHDCLLRELSERCRVLEKVLVDSQPMQEAFAHAASALDEAALKSCFGATPPEDYLKVLAEYIINNVQRLPGYFTTASFWNKHGAEFLKIRQSAEVRRSWDDTVGAASDLRRAVDGLLELLISLRNQLSLSLDVPIADRVTQQVD
jgi:hypothetical protein